MGNDVSNDPKRPPPRTHLIPSLVSERNCLDKEILDLVYK